MQVGRHCMEQILHDGVKILVVEPNYKKCVSDKLYTKNIF